MRVQNNISVKVEGDILTIDVDLSKDQGFSKSGKSLVIATTSGAYTVRAPYEEHPDMDVKVNLNVYRFKHPLEIWDDKDEEEMGK